ncbi:FixH family protein [Paracoccus aurantiacus]|uniref:FixH family protein n=1 Tax=Paracoccus aurantiacus TaxID=2599412 RepID=A0A5C6SAM3_9RHOB|nr:FixH family protein [Paracoccus aurantiacus]TXB71072.1 FixH family protein [Paracoccus aurantiacus]
MPAAFSNPLPLSLLLVLAISAVFFAPFLLFGGHRPVTGRAILAVFLSLFGTILCVNIVMATKAVRSFPGLEVANSYVASQNFDRERSAQQALGWRAEPSYRHGVLSVKISNAQGLPAPVQALRVTVSRPTQRRDDIAPTMRNAGGIWLADLPLPPGAWVLHLEADAPDGTVFRQRLSHYPGSMVRG